jgi:hypothetical protein
MDRQAVFVRDRLQHRLSQLGECAQALHRDLATGSAVLMLTVSALRPGS